jgi:putative membrane protein
LAVILKLVIQSHKQSKTNKPSKKKLFGIGLTMGTADLVPGVSGGTVAFIFGVYDRLLGAVKTFTSTTPQYVLRGKFRLSLQSIPFNFILPLLCGIAVALLTLSNLMSYLLETYPVMIWSVFFGLVSASIYIVSRRVSRWCTSRIASFICGAIVTFILAGATVAVINPNALAYFSTGFIAFSAMILPGISGSLIMVLLGMYGNVIDALSSRDIATLSLVALGGICGLALLSRIITWLLASYHDMTIAFLIGLMTGSLRKIWPWKVELENNDTVGAYIQSNVLPNFDIELFLSVSLIIFSAATVILIDRKYSKTNGAD